MSIRRLIRSLIVPTSDICSFLAGYRFQRCLDVGSGTGLFLEAFLRKGIIGSGIGVEIDRKYFRALNDDVFITCETEIPDVKFDLIMFIDVLHQVDDKISMLNRYIDKYMDTGGYIFVKEMNDENIVYKNVNRVHDLINFRKRIREISKRELNGYFSDGFDLVKEGARVKFLYDHYFVLYRRCAS